MCLKNPVTVKSGRTSTAFPVSSGRATLRFVLVAGTQRRTTYDIISYTIRIGWARATLSVGGLRARLPLKGTTCTGPTACILRNTIAVESRRTDLTNAILCGTALLNPVLVRLANIAPSGIDAVTVFVSRTRTTYSIRIDGTWQCLVLTGTTGASARSHGN
jgi:hypothetical protein